MRIQVRLWASLAEAAGGRKVGVELPPRPLVRDLLKALERERPALKSALSRAAIAINGSVVASDAPVRSGDEVALLPPVSGG